MNFNFNSSRSNDPNGRIDPIGNPNNINNHNPQHHPQSQYPQQVLPPNIYTTADTGLAAWLHYQGFKILKIGKDSTKYHIAFFEDTPKLQETIQLWQMGNAIGNCFVYENARRTVFRMIKLYSGDGQESR
jgi:hypothetical protein